MASGRGMSVAGQAWLDRQADGATIERSETVACLSGK